MKLKIVIVVIIVFASNCVVFSQVELDSLYGLDPLLYNGKMINTYSSQSILGDQFIWGKEFKSGSIELEENTFENILVNYDIYKQEILLKFEINKRQVVIELFKDRVKKFQLDGQDFEIEKDDVSGNYTIYQAIGDDKVQVLYYWYKTLKMSSSVKMKGTHQFSDPLKKMYVKISGKTYKFNNNRTFISNFKKSVKKELRKYIKSNKINVRRSSNNEIKELLKFCNKLLP